MARLALPSAVLCLAGTLAGCSGPGAAFADGAGAPAVFQPSGPASGATARPGAQAAIPGTMVPATTPSTSPSSTSPSSTLPPTTRPAAAGPAAAVRGVASAATSALPPAAVPLLVHGAPAGVKAKAGALADAANGQILWSEGLNAKRPMASITKVMTAYLVISAGGLDRKVSIPPGVKDYVFKYGAASAGLKPGEAITVRELLYALLLASGADAAYALASVYGPGMNGFIAKMNATAAKLGMKNTHFASPDGLPYPTETATYSTPYDLMILGLAAMKLPDFRAVVDQHRYVLAAGPGHAAHVWVNDNDLIGKYQGAVGLKTGYTDVALHCLLFEAVRGNRTLIGVVLASPATGPGAGAQDATRILNWGFTLHAQ